MQAETQLRHWILVTTVAVYCVMQKNLQKSFQNVALETILKISEPVRTVAEPIGILMKYCQSLLEFIYSFVNIANLYSAEKAFELRSPLCSTLVSGIFEV